MGAQTAKTNREQTKTNREDMLPFSDGEHNVYGPDTLEVMCAAYDTAVQLLPPNLQDRERARRRLALLILRHMDRGESERDIVNLALLDFLRVTQ